MMASIPSGAAMIKDQQPRPLPGVRNTVAVASGKGGVGKSTVAVNLAVCLAERGADVGLMDCDIYGPSLPVMLGVTERPVADPQTQMLGPLRKEGLRLMSMGFLSDEQTPVIWRGPMVHKVVTALMQQVDWGRLDYLVVDLPPTTRGRGTACTPHARLMMEQNHGARRR
jgi:ATP-binding protein involved in chromosome partitioning